MKALKRILGLVWIILGPLSTIFMFWQAWDKINAAPAGIDQTNTALQWGIILLIFIPIAAGLVIFGKYALDGEFDNLPTKSQEL
jgi:hypothetical protein